jgi:hypothetical protein
VTGEFPGPGVEVARFTGAANALTAFVNSDVEQTQARTLASNWSGSPYAGGGNATLSVEMATNGNIWVIIWREG